MTTLTLDDSTFINNSENIFISNVKYKKVVIKNQQKVINSGLLNYAITLGDARRSLDNSNSIVASYNLQLGHTLRCAILIEKSLVAETPIQANFTTRGPNPKNVINCVGFSNVPQLLFDGNSTSKLEVGKHVFVIKQQNSAINGPYTIANINTSNGEVDIVRYPYNSIIELTVNTSTDNYFNYTQELSRQTSYLIESGPKYGGTLWLRSSESTPPFPPANEFLTIENIYKKTEIGYSSKPLKTILCENSSGVKKLSDSSFSVGYLTYDINLDDIFDNTPPFTPLDQVVIDSNTYDSTNQELTLFVYPGVDWGYNQIKRFRNFSRKIGIVILLKNDINVNIPTFETGFCIYYDNSFYTGVVLKKASFSTVDEKVYPSTVVLERSGASNKLQVIASTTGLIDGSMNLNIQMIGELQQ